MQLRKAAEGFLGRPDESEPLAPWLLLPFALNKSNLTASRKFCNVYKLVPLYAVPVQCSSCAQSLCRGLLENGMFTMLKDMNMGCSWADPKFTLRCRLGVPSRAASKCGCSQA